MKKLINLFPFVFICILLLNNCEDNPTSIEDPFNNFDKETKDLLIELENIVTPINGSNPSSDNSDLKFLDHFSETKIIALGEATKGTKEFIQMKHRIFKYLVEKHNFKVLASEADYAASLPINQFVLNGEGDLDHLLKNVMPSWSWRTEEVKALLMWMREYNSSKPDNEKIHFFGYNCQNKKYYPNMIMNYIQKVDPTYLNEISSVLIELNKEEQDHFYHISEDQISDFLKYFDGLIEHFKNKADTYINASSNYDYHTNFQLVKVLKQILISNSSNVRDYRGDFMAENHDWIIKLIGSDTKIVSWAHNDQVFNIPNENTMGTYLKFRYEKECKLIGFGFSTGKFQALLYDPTTGSFPSTVRINEINTEPLKTSTNYILHNIITKNYIIDFTKLSSGKLFNYFNTQQYFLSIGGGYTGNPLTYYNRYVIKNCIDFLIYFDNTEAAVELQ